MVRYGQGDENEAFEEYLGRYGADFLRIIRAESYPDTRNGFARDHARLIRDARRVAGELNEKAEKVYGKQKYAD